MKRVEGKTAIVTGGGRGLGKAICLTLANEGADVFILDMDMENAEQTAAEIAALGKKSKAFKANICNSEEVNAAINSIISDQGKIDILVNNAGLVTTHENILTVTDEIWEKEINVNLTGTFYCCRAVLAKMIEQGSGKIVNIASLAGETGRPQTGPAYSAAKAGVFGLTRSLARSVANYGINANAVSPGVILTGIHKDYSKEVLDQLLAQIPYKRGGVPEDIANAVLFLASNDSDYITGEFIKVNGGSFMA